MINVLNDRVEIVLVRIVCEVQKFFHQDQMLVELGPKIEIELDRLVASCSCVENLKACLPDCKFSET